jgi:hypothetical protein
MKLRWNAARKMIEKDMQTEHMARAHHQIFDQPGTVTSAGSEMKSESPAGLGLEEQHIHYIQRR